MTDPNFEPSLPQNEPPSVLPAPSEEPSEEPLEEPLEVLPAKPPGPHIGWACLWALAFVFITQIMLGIPLAILVLVIAGFQLQPDRLFEDPAVAQRFADEALELESSKTMLILGGQIGNVTVALGFALVAYRWRVGRLLGIRGVNWPHVLLILLITLPQYVLLGSIYALVKPHVPNLKLLESAGEMLKGLPWPVLVIGISVLPGIGEEIFCRGFLGRGLVARHGPWLGVAFASILFGLIHIEPAQAAYAIVMGVGVHVVYLSTKSLTAAMLLHATNNAVAVLLGDWVLKLLLGEEVFVALNAAEDMDFLMPWPVASTALAAVVGLLVLFWMTRVRWLKADGTEWQPGYVTAETPPPDAGARPRLTVPPAWAIALALVTLGAFVGVFVWRGMA